MRFMQRTSVDFPQPDGPMMAVTVFGSATTFTSFRTCVAPNQAFKPDASILLTRASSVVDG